MPDPDEEEYQRNKGVGASNYHVTDLAIPTIERPPTNYAEDVETNPRNGVALDVLDWVWREWNIAGGQGFLDATVSPLAGNYNSIAANGKAWCEVGKQFGQLVGNMGTNAGKLAAEHWEGEAAVAFGQFLEVYWNKGAAWAGEQLGLFLKKGFDMVAEVSMKTAEEAIKIIDDMIGVAGRIAMRGIPFLGWARTAIESFASLFGWAENIIDDINKLVELWNTITGLFEEIKSLAESIKEYIAGIEEFFDIVKKIPEISSVQDAAVIYEDISAGSAEMQEKQGEITAKVNEADETLQGIEEKAEKAGG